MTDAVMADRERSRSPRRDTRPTNQIVQDNRSTNQIIHDIYQQIAETQRCRMEALDKIHADALAGRDACIQLLTTRSMLALDVEMEHKAIIREQQWTIENLQKTIDNLEKDLEKARLTLCSRPLASDAAPQVGRGFGGR